MGRAFSMTLMRLSVCKHVQSGRLPSLMMQSYMEPCLTPHSQHGAPASSQGWFTCPRMSEMCVDSIKSGLSMGHTGPRAAPQARAGCGGSIGVVLRAREEHRASGSGPTSLSQSLSQSLRGSEKESLFSEVERL